jgi:hypothetical protein
MERTKPGSLRFGLTVICVIKGCLALIADQSALMNRVESEVALIARGFH